MLRRKNPAPRRRSSVDMWTTQGRCPHTHTSSNSDSQRYLFDYFRLDRSGSRYNPQESWADAHVTVAAPSMRGFRQPFTAATSSTSPTSQTWPAGPGGRVRPPPGALLPTAAASVPDHPSPIPPSEARRSPERAGFRVSGPPGRGSRLHTACIIFFADAATGQDPAAAQR
jgi:hypothetical protein